MARLARVEVFAPDEIAVVHVMNRVVRRCFLMGDDPVTGKNFDHRKKWVESELERLAGGFSIDLLCYSVLSNHFHLILRSRPDVLATWDDTEVARRWLHLCPVSGSRKVGRKAATEAEVKAICNNPSKLKELRRRLSDISWWMRLLCQRIAQRANREEEETSGKFWQNRYRAVRLLDEESILACAAYVDLNPVRAGLAEEIETSEFTSVQRRIQATREASAAEPTPNLTSPASAPRTADCFLSPLAIDELRDELGPRANQRYERCSDKGFLTMRIHEYLTLLKWTVHNIRPKQRETASSIPVPRFFERLGLKPRTWLVLVRNFGNLFSVVAGQPHHVDNYRSRCRQQSFQLRRATRELLSA